MVHTAASPSSPDSEPGSECHFFDDDESMFRASCVSNLKRFLQKRKGMTAAAAKEFISERVKIKVDHAIDDEVEMKTVHVFSQIRAASGPTGSALPVINLEYYYRHKCRALLEHNVELTYRMAGARGRFFRTLVEDLPSKDERQIERRSFTFTQDQANLMRDTIFGEGWSVIEAVLVCYAAAGVSYCDSSACLQNLAQAPVIKRHWLEYHTKRICDVLDTDDDGYDSEPFSERYQAEMDDIRRTGQSTEVDIDYEKLLQIFGLRS